MGAKKVVNLNGRGLPVGQCMRTVGDNVEFVEHFLLEPNFKSLDLLP